MSARLNFQFLSGSSMRPRNRFRCSSWERWRKILMVRVPFRYRWVSRSTIERYRSSQIVFSSRNSSRSESLSLFFLGKVEKDFDGSRPVPIQVGFEIHDRTIPLIPDCFLVAQLFQIGIAFAVLPGKGGERF